MRFTPPLFPATTEKFFKKQENGKFNDGDYVPDPKDVESASAPSTSGVNIQGDHNTVNNISVTNNVTTNNINIVRNDFYKISEEDNQDWKFVSITPPPKKS